MTLLRRLVEQLGEYWQTSVEVHRLLARHAFAGPARRGRRAPHLVLVHVRRAA